MRAPHLHADEDTLDSTRGGSGGRESPDDPRVQARLLGVHPEGLRVRVDLTGHPLVLGRAPSDPCSPPLPHPTVSRSHLELVWDPRSGRHVARDLGSRNGSAVDGVPLASGWRPLAEGSVLRLGDVVLVYELGQELDPPEPPGISREAVPGLAVRMRRLRGMVARAAPDISPALIIGETGTGKERLAAELHRASGRKGAFVAVNCATFGEQLFESQLFGHVKGAFTGADSDNAGLFRAADGGTLFLDEIGDMPLDVQPKLLRAIQEGEIRPVGSTKPIRVDVRIVGATHHPLPVRVAEGKFRQDLYARLALWQLELPPVRLRRSDILFWIDHLHAMWAEARGMDSSAPRFDADAATALLLAPWKENLRAVDRLVHELASTGATPGVLRRQDLPSWVEAT